MTAAPRFSLLRLGKLFEKEALQMARDPSVFVIGLFLPVLLVILFGYGLSMDMSEVPAAVVMGERTALTSEIAARFRGTRYFEPVFLPTRQAAEDLMRRRQVEAIVEMPAGFSRDASRGEAVLGLTLHGVDSNAAMMIRTYAYAAVSLALEKMQLREDAVQILGADLNAASASSASSAASSAASSSSASPSPTAASSAASPSVPAVQVVSRAWFNEANASAWYLVPGLTVVVMTLVCSFMGSLVIAREWERGTMESLCATPAAAFEVLLAKFAANFLVSGFGLAFCFFMSKWAFGVPLRGSGWLFAATMLVYDAWALSFGLFLSAATKRQFIAIQMAVIGSYLPALLLSGYLFDLRSVPWWISAVGHLMPPTYAIESAKILCLSGGPVSTVLSNLCILAACAIGFFALALAFTRKRLD